MLRRCLSMVPISGEVPEALVEAAPEYFRLPVDKICCLNSLSQPGASRGHALSGQGNC
jgi:hypothetical protein